MNSQESDVSTELYLRRVAERWNQTTESREKTTLQGWLDSYYIASERLNARASGSPSVNWLTGLVRRLKIVSARIDLGV